MKVILAMAISLNGSVARENGEEDWLPEEGWSEFLIEAKKFNNFVMGRETYEVVQRLYKDHNFDDVITGNKVIITRNEDFKAGAAYIIVYSPSDAIKYLESRGESTMLLIGGGKLNSDFLGQGLVDELWLTVSPFILGKGRPFISPQELDIKLKLIDAKPISLDRLLMRYEVKK